jgi:hypothetical protein
VTETLTPMKKQADTRRAAGSGVAPQRQCSEEGTSPLRKRLRPNRPVSVVQNLLEQGISLSSNSGSQDDAAADRGVDGADADSLQGCDSDPVPSRGVKDPSTCNVVKKEGSIGRRNSRRHQQVCLIDFHFHTSYKLSCLC